ncbi:nascent polypeptide-associated complex protein [archaeon]|nr:nascent polypeptide-associated complex protein [archaeon]NCP79705.1 nascent polypeptide-associated complex protein [archaeon]NCP97995.1 nascent polypeptide-associated complex protein [archaeon]NCQ07471.1 nascent polypeptide-associated complex protein [archaeon]NCQ51262.1 nascent polypeptide-associated complex protein [archaeon]
MIPGMNGMDPRKMNALMKQMGIENNDIDAAKVIIELKDGSVIEVIDPSVTEIVMQGNRSFQVAGTVTTKEVLTIPQEDIDMVSESANVSKEKAKETLEETKGDIAEAISKLSE